MSQGVINRHRPEWQQGEDAVRQLVVDELEAAGVEEAGFAWGLQRVPTDPRCACAKSRAQPVGSENYQISANRYLC